MQNKNTEVDFSNQRFYIGLDVHKKSWKITIRTNQMELKTFSMDPRPEELLKYIQRNYPNGEYLSVYEAGFCGYWIDKQLRQLGIKNIVVNGADVPSKSKERINKDDIIDSRKLARELENGTLKGIYIPNDFYEGIRSLCRLRYSITKEQTRIKTRIKSLLTYYGKDFPENYECKNWSGRFINFLEGIEFNQVTAKQTLNHLLKELKDKKQRLAEIIRELRDSTKEAGIGGKIKQIMSIPGISFITAITFYTEIMDMRRFKRLDELCSFVGLVPATYSSGDRERVLGLSNRQSKYLRNLLFESSWVAIRNDPALMMKFGELTQRMVKQKAIVRIARKILNRMRHIWLNDTEYVIALVQ
jgi:transposase